MNKNVLICLNKLGIGGVETVVINQTKELIERGYNVIILAEEGIYTNIATESGAICINFEFKMIGGFNYENSEKVKNIIKEYDIGQIHVHQLDCISNIFPAIIETNTPYIAFVHTGIPDVYSIFEKYFPGYRAIFSMFFNMAEKIIAITESAKEENKHQYNIKDDSKYMIMRNSIKFDENLIKNENIPTKPQKFLIVSRLAEEKKVSLKNAINVFKGYHKLHPETKLTLIGGGDIADDILKEIEDIKDSTVFLGERNDVINQMMEHDVVIALDRCILEAISTKRIAILSGYENIGGIISNQNIEEASSENFSGRKLKPKTVDEVVEELNNLTSNTIEQIVMSNFNYAFENLNCKKNVYALKEAKDLKFDSELLYKNINELLIENANNKRIASEIWQAKLYLEEQNNNKDKLIKELEDNIAKLKDENNKINLENERIMNKSFIGILHKIKRKITGVVKKFLK